MKVWIGAIVGSCALVAGAAAQVTGTVVSEGRPVAGARVELWSPTRRVAERVTGSDGAFKFVALDSATATAIIARRIGFAPLRVALSATTGPLTLRMRAVPQTLAEVTVRAARDLCPNQPTDSARAAWTRLQIRYASGSGYSRGTRTLQFNGVIPKEMIGEPDTTRLSRGETVTTATGIAYDQLLVVRFGYAWPSPREGGDPDYGSWNYPRLDADYVQHFIEPMFAQRHQFSVVRGSDEETELIFCPADRKKSGLEGLFRIASDGSPISARWIYYNPDAGAEEAGGEVTFAPRDDESPNPILLAATGVFWRKLRHGDYYERWQEFEGWKVEPGDSMLTKRH